MKIPPEFQVIIGIGIASIVITLFGWIRSYSKESLAVGESQRPIVFALVLALLGLLTFGITSIIAIAICVHHILKKKRDGFAKLVIGFSILTLLPTIAVVIFGP